MGIRFSCSNGHKLNIKTELAGRKGFCPQCGVAVRIPRENEKPEKPEKKTSGPTVTTLSADPNAVWYLQVPHGPQYGPATGAVVENWIKERRVSPEMLVWKEGWDHWLEAKNAFPELAQLFSNALNIDLPPVAKNESALPGIPLVSLTPQTREKIRKKKKLSRNMLILTALTGLIVLLGILLIGILHR